ncbi:MAG: hypothetical protein U9Q78_04595 [Chloroflexota bacterium]|nr:hypothetical protein [Chloroflexota bacterium]
MAILLCLLSGCRLPAPVAQVTGRPPRARIEAALPSLLEQVEQVTVYGPDEGKRTLQPQDVAFDSTVREALRIAMASCVRFYCTPREEAILGRMETDSGIQLDFQPPQDVPTALPLPGWFGPLRGCEEMKGVESLYLILEKGRWAEVIARGADGTWSCWKSNWQSK